MEEIRWMPISGYQGIYEVSSDGAVRSLDRTIKLSNGGSRYIQGQRLSLKENGGGYMFVTLSKDGKSKTCYIHRLLGTAFIVNEANNPFINHLDGNPSNNDLSNLEWVSHSENVAHAYATGLNSNKEGNHPFAVGVIDNELGASFDTVKEWAIARKLNYSTARNILSGCNGSRRIDLTKIAKTKKSKNNE